MPKKKLKNVVLVGLMGAGKTRVGRELAGLMQLPFVDSDSEIEKAAGCSIPDIFERFGEADFRSGERRVIKRLLKRDGIVLATGGGAFMNDETRGNIEKSGAVSVWLRAGLDVLVERTGRTDHRPLLKTGDPEEILARLIDERYPVYAKADIVVESDGRPAAAVAQEIKQRVEDWRAVEKA